MVRSARSTPAAMPFETYLEFLEGRPDGERWELVEGLPVMNPAPTDVHQIIVANIVSALLRAAEDSGADWLPLPGHGVPVPGSTVLNAPMPDVVVRRGLTGASYSADPIVVFEVLSNSNRRADRAWRSASYASVPSIRCYVTVSQTIRRCDLHTRENGWSGESIEGAHASIPLPALDLELPLSRIYRHTALAVTG